MIPQLYNCFSHWAEKGTVWIYSDPHFSDTERAVFGRPTDEEQIKMINSKVGKNDTLIILGDVGNIECVKKIRGYKVLIMGNHDKGRSNYERKIIERKFDKKNYSKEQVIEEMKKDFPNDQINVEECYSLSVAPFSFWLASADNRLFDEVYEGPLFIGEKLILSHEPIDFPFALNLHGHVHKGQAKPYHINCCSNLINYTPISLNQIVKSGALKINSIHRETIDNATKRASKRNKSF